MHKESKINSLGALKANEALARFLLQRNRFNLNNYTVKSTAFMPYPYQKLSVFRIKELSEAKIWEIGERFVSQPLSKNLYGRADIVVAVIQNVGLQIDPDNIPPRHANIIGWPKEKSEQKLLAIELAGKANLKLCK